MVGAMEPDAGEGPIDPLLALFADADRAVALTGAGISTPSGIPDFRGEDGIWNGAFDPDAFHRRRFEADPAGFWADRVELRDRLFRGEVHPNAAHEALVSLERAGGLEALITQNTDGLHAAAGSRAVIELHGNASRVACERCGRRWPAEPAVERARGGERPPTCRACDGVLKPDVVLFGEPLPDGAISRARELVTGCDLLVAIGTSLQVEPAASLPIRAREAGASVAVLNLGPTPVDGRADVVLREDVTAVLPAVAERLGA